MESRRPSVIGYHDEGAGPGGTSRYLCDLISQLDRCQFRPVFFASRPRDWHQRIERLDVELIYPEGRSGPPSTAVRRGQAGSRGTARSLFRHLPGLPWLAGLVRETAELARLFGTRRVDLLHTNQAGAEPASIAARLARVPLVVGTWHVDSTYDLDGRCSGLRYRLLECLAMRSFHHSISVSHDTRADWIRRCSLGARYHDRISVIHNGINPRHYEPRNTTAKARALLGLEGVGPVLGVLGRLDPAKGHRYLLEAMPAVLRRHPGSILLIAGAGPLEPDLAALADTLGISGATRFLGFQQDPRLFLEALDIYIQPSLCESLGLSVLEAGAAGLPIVASSVGGIRETVLDGKTGILVPVGDPAAIASAVLRLSGDERLREELGTAARHRVREYFTRERMAEETAALYRLLLEHRSRLPEGCGKAL